MDSVLFEYGWFSIKWYSVFILLGMIMGSLIFYQEAKDKKLSKDDMENIIFYGLLFGILGARLYYVLFNLDYYGKDLTRIFAMWEGGLAIHGGVIGGFIGLLVMCIKNKVSIFRTTDMIAPGLLIAQAIGRWGNFFNSEAYGPVTTIENLRSLKFIPEFVIKGMKIGGVYYHPTFFYESVWCILGFILILLVRRYLKYIKVGQISCIYFMWYGIGRWFVESLRTDSLMLGTYKVAQIVSIIGMVGGFIVFTYLCVNWKYKNYYRSK